MAYQVVPKRTWRWYIRWLLLAVILLAASYALGLATAAQRKAIWQAQYTELQNRLARTLEDMSNMRRKLAQLEAEAQMARASVKTSQEELEKLQHDKQRLEKELAFYRSIMAPENNKKGLTIDSLAIRAGDKPQQWHYELVLTQAKKQDWYLKGTVNFTITGRQNEQPLQLSGNTLFPEQGMMPRFSFRFFQRLTGVIQLPSGFTPEKISITATTRDGKHKTSAEFDWSEIEEPNHARKQKEAS